jgi:hypothetical protein
MGQLDLSILYLFIEMFRTEQMSTRSFFRRGCVSWNYRGIYILHCMIWRKLAPGSTSSNGTDHVNPEDKFLGLCLIQSWKRLSALKCRLGAQLCCKE